MKSRSTLVLAASVAALLSACKDSGPPPAPPPPLVEVSEVKATDVAVYREIVATLQGTVNTNVKPKVEGYLLTQEYEDGAMVDKGQLLFTIDPDPFEIAVQGAAADVQQAEAQLVKAELDVERNRELIKADAISQKQLDNSEQAVQAAQAQVEAAKAALANAKLNLSYCEVYSPVTGIAGKAQGEIGDLVGPSSILTTISSLDPVQAVFFIPEQAYLERSADLRKALEVPFEKRPENLELILGNGRNYPHKGRLQFINRQIEEGTGTIGLYALFPNPGSVLRPGQYAKVRGRVNTIQDALLIPQRAVKETQGMFFVFTVNKDGTVSSVSVEQGETRGSDVVITSGLKAGDTIVVEGVQKVKNGMKVRAQPWKRDDGQKASAADGQQGDSPPPPSGSADKDDKGDSAGTSVGASAEAPSAGN